MSTTPAPSPLTDHDNLRDEPEPTLIRRLPTLPEVAPPTDFELEMRRRLAAIEGHLARNDSLIMQAMADTRTQVRKATDHFDVRFGELKSILGGLAKDLRTLVSNGHG